MIDCCVATLCRTWHGGWRLEESRVHDPDTKPAIFSDVARIQSVTTVLDNTANPNIESRCSWRIPEFERHRLSYLTARGRRAKVFINPKNQRKLQLIFLILNINIQFLKRTASVTNGVCVVHLNRIVVRKSVKFFGKIGRRCSIAGLDPSL